MIDRVYRWERTQFERNKATDKWREIPEDFEVFYITEDWRDEKVGASERAFWEGIGSSFAIEKDAYGDPVFVSCVSPDELSCFEETFDEHIIDVKNLGWRECQALEESEDMRRFPILMDTKEHVVIQFGNKTKADYDLVTREWC